MLQNKVEVVMLSCVKGFFYKLPLHPFRAAAVAVGGLGNLVPVLGIGGLAAAVGTVFRS